MWELDIINQHPERFNIHKDAILLPQTRFRFDVPGRNETPCVSIGANSMVNCNFIFESTDGSINIGDSTFINGGTNLISRESISIGNDVVIAWGCYIYDHDSHSLNWEDRTRDVKQQIRDYKEYGNMVLNKDWSTVRSKAIVIHDKVWIGFDSLVLKGVTIGEGAVVGAKSVVTKDVEPWTVVAGNPAKIVKRLKNNE